MYRRDVVPGATEPSPLRLPMTEVGRFLELEDSVYNYKANELLSRRSEVEVRDDVPTYYHKSKRYVRGKKGRASRKARATRGRAKATKSRAKASRSRGKATRKAKSTGRKSAGSKKRRTSKRRR